MALQFRKSIRLAPGIRWNLSGSGSSWTFGPRGASINVGSRGTYLNSGIPGTGLYSRTRLSPSTEPREEAAPTRSKVFFNCGVQDDGTLFFVDDAGCPVPERLVERAKKEKRDVILGLIQRMCDQINEQIESLGRLHCDTPDPKTKPQFVAPSFHEPQPAKPQPKRLGWLDKLFRNRRRRVEDANRVANERYSEALEEWAKRKADFDEQVAHRRLLIESLIYEDVAAMGTFLDERLQEIEWPRETSVDVAIEEGGARVMLNVDFPELEDMPTRVAEMPLRGLKLSVKPLTPTRVQRLYAEHVHGILFRLIGEVFAALAKTQTVVASGYSQRRDPATAQLRDDYLLSVRVSRSKWVETDFAHLTAIDVVEALARFDLRREMSKSGVLKSISPYTE